MSNIYKISYKLEYKKVKQTIFLGSSLQDLRAFPDDARKEAGYQLDRVQCGLEPNNWKPMKNVGQGVCEIRIRDNSGAFRVMYYAKFEDAVYVLHCFQKKSNKTSSPDLELTVKRYRDLVKEKQR